MRCYTLFPPLPRFSRAVWKGRRQRLPTLHRRSSRSPTQRSRNPPPAGGSRTLRDRGTRCARQFRLRLRLYLRCWVSLLLIAVTLRAASVCRSTLPQQPQPIPEAPPTGASTAQHRVVACWRTSLQRRRTAPDRAPWAPARHHVRLPKASPALHQTIRGHGTVAQPDNHTLTSHCREVARSYARFLGVCVVSLKPL